MFNLLNPLNTLVPDQLSTRVERPLEQRAHPVQLSAVDGESALRFVRGGPVLALAFFAAVEVWRFFAVCVDAVGAARAVAAGWSSAVSTFFRWLLWRG